MEEIQPFPSYMECMIIMIKDNDRLEARMGGMLTDVYTISTIVIGLMNFE